MMILRSRQSHSTPWHSGPFTKACAHPCAARLHLWKKNCRMFLRNSEAKHGKCSLRKKRYWPAKNSDELQVMLEAYLLDKAVYEIGFELNNRPSWVLIPVRGIKHILQTT